MANEIEKRNEAFLIYQDENGIARVNVRFEGEDVWLLQEQIMELFDASRQDVNYHINQIYAGYLIRFSPQKNILNPQYLNVLTHHSEYKTWAALTRGGTAQPNINAEQYSQYRIPLAPLDVQNNIVAECEIIDAENTDAQKSVADCEGEIKKIIEDVKGDDIRISDIGNKNYRSKRDYGWMFISQTSNP